MIMRNNIKIEGKKMLLWISVNEALTLFIHELLLNGTLVLPDKSILEVDKNCIEQNVCNNSIQINGCISAFEHILSRVSVPCISLKVANFQPVGAVFKIPVILRVPCFHKCLFVFV